MAIFLPQNAYLGRVVDENPHKASQNALVFLALLFPRFSVHLRVFAVFLRVFPCFARVFHKKVPVNVNVPVIFPIFAAK